jgi:hypothetical protein
MDEPSDALGVLEAIRGRGSGAGAGAGAGAWVGARAGAQGQGQAWMTIAPVVWRDAYPNRCEKSWNTQAETAVHCTSKS